MPRCIINGSAATRFVSLNRGQSSTYSFRRNLKLTATHGIDYLAQRVGNARATNGVEQPVDCTSASFIESQDMQSINVRRIRRRSGAKKPVEEHGIIVKCQTQGEAREALGVRQEVPEVVHVAKASLLDFHSRAIDGNWSTQQRDRLKSSVNMFQYRRRNSGLFNFLSSRNTWGSVGCHPFHGLAQWYLMVVVDVPRAGGEPPRCDMESGEPYILDVDFFQDITAGVNTIMSRLRPTAINPEEHAVVSSLHTDSYIRPISALGHSLKFADMNVRRILVYIQPSVSSGSLRLATAAEWTVHPVSRIALPHHGKGVNRLYLDQYTKQHMDIGLDRDLVYVDADTLVTPPDFFLSCSRSLTAMRPCQTSRRLDHRGVRGHAKIGGAAAVRVQREHRDKVAEPAAALWKAMVPDLCIVHYTLDKPFPVQGQGRQSVKEFFESPLDPGRGLWTEEIAWWQESWRETAATLKNKAAHC
ncbi:hypothetical protein JB92DRAFT_3097616 [Gautieria morchelliformis]|nr:hypothetical protein JB92DRAFT_3097616 [Gautieria morchelliformis]